MKRKNQNKNYCARDVTLIIVLNNIYQIFHPITLLKHMLITNQYLATNYCLINSVINTLTTFPRRIYTTPIQGLKTLEDNAKTCSFPALLNEGEKCFLSKGTCVRVKKEIKFCNFIKSLQLY